jgi:tetratricopeptide (TPR) repeat protein
MSLTNRILYNWFRIVGILLVIIGFSTACGSKNKTEAAEFFERGNYHFKKNETERALELFTEAIEKVPDFADAYNNRGLCYEKLDNIEKARNDYRKAVELDDSFNQAKFNLAAAQLLMGEMKETEKLLLELAPAYSDSSQFYDLRGKYSIQTYESDAAIIDFNKSLSLNPSNLETKTNLGYAFYMKRDFEKAKSIFLEVLKTDSNFTFALNNLSATYAQLNDWKEALDYSSKAIKNQPNEVTFLNTHSLNLVENNLLSEAAGFIDQTLKLQPKNPYSLRNYGILQLKSEDIKGAITTLSNIESTHPDVEFIYYYFGETSRKMGNKSKACKMFKRGAELNDNRCVNAALSCQ